MKRLIVCFDGTWQVIGQDPTQKEGKTSTNVVTISQAIKPVAKNGTPQIVYYHPGLGTRSKIENIIGGYLGWGIDQDIQNAYRFLCLNYELGDEIYLFGYSRGAYLARSLSGLINCSGLVKRNRQDLSNLIFHAYENYRNPQPEYHPRGQISQAFRRNKDAIYNPEEREVSIKLLACWDTVGSLGIPDLIPFLPIDQYFNKKYRFYDTKLSSMIDYALHAVAIDESRRTFNVTPMTLEDELSFIVKNGLQAFVYKSCNSLKLKIKESEWESLIKYIKNEKGQEITEEIRKITNPKSNQEQIKEKLRDGLNAITQELTKQFPQSIEDKQDREEIINKIAEKIDNFLETTPTSKFNRNTHTKLNQTWFPGVHGCVGGGQQSTKGLSDAALQWMVNQINLWQQNSGESPAIGLEFDEKFLQEVVQEQYDVKFTQATSNALANLINGTIWRDVVCEFSDFHPSVGKRWKDQNINPPYRPKNLTDYYSEWFEQLPEDKI